MPHYQDKNRAKRRTIKVLGMAFTTAKFAGRATSKLIYNQMEGGASIQVQTRAQSRFRVNKSKPNGDGTHSPTVILLTTAYENKHLPILERRSKLRYENDQTSKNKIKLSFESGQVSRGRSNLRFTEQEVAAERRFVFPEAKTTNMKSAGMSCPRR